MIAALILKHSYHFVDVNKMVKRRILRLPRWLIHLDTIIHELPRIRGNYNKFVIVT